MAIRINIRNVTERLAVRSSIASPLQQIRRTKRASQTLISPKQIRENGNTTGVE